MTTASIRLNLLPQARTRLEKAALDNGFDIALPAVDGWLPFASTQAPLRVWLIDVPDAGFLVALSQAHVAQELGSPEHGGMNCPAGTAALLPAADIPAVHHLLRRAFQLSKTLPDELLHIFEKQTAKLPRTTEAERLVVQRVGQDVFRDGLFEYWDGRCAITGLAIPELLRASHIKPWCDCETDAERLDVFNGLLLAPHLDATFDRGFITVADDGVVLVSARLAAHDRQLLSLDVPMRLIGLHPAHTSYLLYHRDRIFRT